MLKKKNYYLYYATTGNIVRNDAFYSISDTGDSLEENPSSPNRSRTYDLLVTSPDALQMSYRRLVGAKAIKLGPW